MNEKNDIESALIKLEDKVALILADGVVSPEELDALMDDMAAFDVEDTPAMREMVLSLLAEHQHDKAITKQKIPAELRQKARDLLKKAGINTIMDIERGKHLTPSMTTDRALMEERSRAQMGDDKHKGHVSLNAHLKNRRGKGHMPRGK